jgi:hypothetical protein
MMSRFNSFSDSLKSPVFLGMVTIFVISFIILLIGNSAPTYPSFFVSATPELVRGHPGEEYLYSQTLNSTGDRLFYSLNTSDEIIRYYTQISSKRLHLLILQEIFGYGFLDVEHYDYEDVLYFHHGPMFMDTTEMFLGEDTRLGYTTRIRVSANPQLPMVKTILTLFLLFAGISMIPISYVLTNLLSGPLDSLKRYLKDNVLRCSPLSIFGRSWIAICGFFLLYLVIGPSFGQFNRDTMELTLSPFYVEIARVAPVGSSVAPVACYLHLVCVPGLNLPISQDYTYTIYYANILIWATIGALVISLFSYVYRRFYLAKDTN